MGREPELQQAVATVDTLAAIIESADDAIIGKRLDGTILSWNSGAERLFGYSAAEIVGHSVMRLIPEGRENEETDIIRQLRRGDPVRHFETQRRHRAGHLVDISLSISPIRDAMGRIVGASKIARDISELVSTRASESRTRAALATRSQINQLLARAGSGPVLACGFTEALVANGHATAALVLHGATDSGLTVIGSAGFDGSPDDLVQALPALDDWVREARRHSARCEVRPWSEPGQPPWPTAGQAVALLPLSSLVEPGMGMGAHLGCLVVFGTTLKSFDRPQIDLLGALSQDLVFGLDHLRREQALVEAREAAALAKASERARTELLSRVSHELRQPLTAITGYTELLQRAAAHEGRPATEPLERILAASRHLNTLIGDLLDLSLIEGGHLQVHNEPLDAAAALRDAMALVGPQAEAAGVALHLEMPPGEPLRAQADAARLRQVLTNLLSNAIKYNRAQGTVRVSALLHGHEVQLAVSDNGLGIAAERLPELFQPFNRLGRETSGIPGSGVGLALTWELVNRMRGHIGVDSQLGVGTTVTVTLQAAAPEEPRSSAVTEPRGTVLSVDDDPVVRLLLQALLARWPAVDVMAAADGDEAFVLALQHRPDLLIVDLHLANGASGLEVMSRLRQHTSLAQVPALLLTGSASPADHRAAQLAGAEGLLSKPLDAAQLLPWVAQLLTTPRT